jgi:hypothetical protein
MRPSAQVRTTGKKEAGYALLLVIFFLALLVLATVAVAPNILTKGKREKEAEMVWRGRQYARGVRMYYMKFQKFPTSMDDLTKPKNGIRFMRQAYKDPMNGTDGSWRLIYVGPSGQLIGSLKSRSIALGGIGGANASAAQGIGGSSFGNNSLSGSSFGTGGGGNSSFGNSSFGNSSFGNSSATTTSQNTASSSTTGTQNPTTGDSSDPNNPDSQDAMGTPRDLGTMDASSVIGGNIIGVGSKVNQKSVMWYEKAKNYRQFEFIWDPSKDMMVGAASRGIGTPVQNINGTSPTGTGLPGSGPTQNPQQNQNIGNPDPTQNPPLQAPQSNP